MSPLIERTTSVTLKGFGQLDRKLQRLGNDMRADVVSSALVESAEPMEQTYKREAPKWMRKGIKTRIVENNRNVAHIAIGSRHPLVAIFEFGTRRRRTKETGAYRGRIEALGFARRTFDMRIQGWFRGIPRLIWARLRRHRAR